MNKLFMCNFDFYFDSCPVVVSGVSRTSGHQCPFIC